MCSEQFSAGSRLDDRLFAAWTSLGGGGHPGQWYATEALAKRCEEVIMSFCVQSMCGQRSTHDSIQLLSVPRGFHVNCAHTQ